MSATTATPGIGHARQRASRAETGLILLMAACNLAMLAALGYRASSTVSQAVDTLLSSLTQLLHAALN